MTPPFLAALLLSAVPPVTVSRVPTTRTDLDVPIVVQAPERCGQAALEMVLRYYGANPAAIHEADRACDPDLRGSPITDLAAAARRAGYDAVIGTFTPESLVAEIAAGVPPIVLYQNGQGPITVGHFAVVTGWNPWRREFTLNDGGAHPRVMGCQNFETRWRTAGSQALILRQRS